MLDNSQRNFKLATNLSGRIRNLSLSPSPVNSVYPLLEAIMNGVQAVHDRFGDDGLDRGKISIILSRSETDVSISIQDNGIGLNDRNFASFLTPDTDHRLAKGGKGVGRLTWLKTFAKANVTSFYSEDDKTFRRSFTFRIDEDNTISDHVHEAISTQEGTGTTVDLLSMRDGYLQTFPAKSSTVSNHIIRHFLPVFISRKCPQIIFLDNDREVDIAAELERNIYERKSEVVEFRTSDEKDVVLNLTHMRISSRYAPKSTPANMMKEGKPHNAVYFAAAQRVGFEYSLDNQLGMKTFDRCKYIGILEGEFIDSHINQERTHLDLPPDDILTLKNQVFESVLVFLASYMEGVKNDQREVYENLRSEFPSITSCPPENFVEKLPYNIVNPEDILANLAKYKHRALRSAKAETAKLADQIEEVIEADEIQGAQEAKILEIIDGLRPKLTKETNASLAEYMVRRKAIIDLLDKYMGLAENGRHFKEDLIHTLIYPMHRVDNSKKLLEHNLWLLDDRFAFYSFLASDKALNQYTPASELGRPDVLFVLDEQLAFRHTETRESPVFIVEFKRPSKSSYRTSGDRGWDAEDPFDRFASYKEALMSGINGDRTFDGRHIQISESRPVHCFLVADMTKGLERKCRLHLSPIEGANSYFGYVPNLGFVHAISYEDLIHNARLRHDLFFKMLGIPNSLD